MTSKRVAAKVGEGVAAPVHGQAEVCLLRIEAVEPQWDGVVMNLADICLAPNYLAERFDVGVPRAMEVWIAPYMISRVISFMTSIPLFNSAGGSWKSVERG